MKMIVELGTRAHADRLLALDANRRHTLAEIEAEIAHFAETYRVDADDLLGPLDDVISYPATPGPGVSEFAALELGALLGISQRAASGRIVDALTLKNETPVLWDAMQNLDIEVNRAHKARATVRDLTPDAADRVLRRWLPRQAGLSWSGAFKLLQEMVVAADQETAAEREHQARTQLGVAVWGPYHGTLNLTGRLETLDALYFDGQVDRIADLLAQDHPDWTKARRRAKAVGILAHPALALAMLQQAAQPALLDDPDAASQPAPCRGALCGTIQVPRSKLRPSLEVAVHIDVNAVGEPTGAVRIDNAGAITLRLLREYLDGIDVKIQPVIDLNDLPAEDQYRPSANLMKAFKLGLRHELFPYSNRHWKNCDLDHVHPYRSARAKQTRFGNGAWLGRRPHRAKTAGYWLLDIAAPGTVTWTSPLGYRYRVTRHGTRRLE